jgi:hypothetical protein
MDQSALFGTIHRIQQHCLELIEISRADPVAAR